MRSLVLRWYVLTIVVAFSVPTLLAQVITGTYPYGTFDNKGFDTINVGNLNVHFSIPILSKAGRGIPFYYNLSYDSSVWSPTTVNGSPVWRPAPSFGWRGDTEIATGYLSYSVVTVQVGSGGQRSGECIYTYDTNWVYHDPFGVAHQFDGWTVSNSYPTNCGADESSASLSTYDGSGYTLNLTSYTKGKITGADGKQIAVPNISNGQATVTDSNGNQVSANGSGGFTDTTGNTVLTVAGSAPNPHTFTYKDTSGNSQTVSMTYKTYTVQTAFGCSGIGEYGPTSTSLVNSISFPDGSTYSFTYEATPNGSGNVTGRLASVTLPTGGTITYSYSGGSNGIVCADGSTAGLTRSISADTGSAASTWSYSRTIPGTNESHTEVTDGTLNHSAYDFVQASNQVTSTTTSSTTTTAVYYETNRNMYQGAETGTPLLARQTCYNGQAPSCTTASFTIPISQIDTYETLNGIEEHGSTAKYNSSGLQTDQYDYDFGSSSRGALLRHEVWTYGGSIPSLVTLDQIYDGNGNLANKTSYGYDETTGTGHAALAGTSAVPSHISVSGSRGNLTTVTQQSTSAGATASTEATYEDTGDVLASTSPNGQTSYGYDTATHAFVSNVTPPTPSSGVTLTTTAIYDSNTGLLTSTSDPNGTTTKFSYTGMLLPLEIDNLDSGSNMVGKTVFNFESVNQIGVLGYQSASTYADTEPLLDAYSRPSRIAVANGQGTNPWYQQDTCYDADSRVNFQSYRYQGNGWGTPKVCSGSGDTYSYNALGRVTKIAHADGTAINYSYNGHATQVTDENGVSRIYQVDGLGRLTTVCEISSNGSMPSSGSPVSCGTDIPGTGFLTTYSYDLPNHKTTVVQGAQTRIFQTDWLGRPISVTQPEAAAPMTYSYTYNSTGLLVTRQRPQANQTNASVLTTTTTQYDSLGRVLTVSYNDGTPTKTFNYDASSGWAQAQSYVKGRLGGARVNPLVNNWSGEIFSYDAMGNVAFTGLCFPYGCGNSGDDKYVFYNHDWLGNLTSENDGGTAGNIGYSYSTANEITQITGSYEPNGSCCGTYNLVTSVQNGPNGPISYRLGNGLTQSFRFDSLGRLNGGWVCNGSNQNYCSGGQQIYGYTSDVKGAQRQDLCDTVINRCEGLAYDEFNRLKSLTVNTGTVQNYTYVYDRYGNRWQENLTAGTGPHFQFTYNTSNNHLAESGYSYDAAGNILSDGFHTFTYDAEGNLTQVDGGSTASYAYDALNRRIRVQNSSQTADYTFDYLNRRITSWQESNNFGFHGKIYWGSSSQPIAFRYIDGNTYFEHQDWLGTERMVTSYNGAVEGTFITLPFGDNWTVSGLDGDAYHFATLDEDYYGTADSGNAHAQFRELSVARGYWYSPDPYYGSYDTTNPQSMNRYAYVLNNPLSFIDPSGLCDMQNCPCTYGDGTCNVPSDPTSGYPQEIGGGNSGGGPQLPCNGPQLGNCTNSFPVVISVKPGGAPSKAQIIRNALNQKRLHSCSQSLFGNANALTAANAPKIQYLSPSQMSAYLGGYLGAADAAGANNPATNTVYFNSSVFTGSLPSIYYQSNYLHESGNIISFNLYGNETARGNMFVGPNEYPIDPDSGASFERCIFGQRMQIP